MRFFDLVTFNVFFFSHSFEGPIRRRFHVILVLDFVPKDTVCPDILDKDY